ncbi:hypothetical protein NM688_g8992 [Phlebia brevispora]|uniref:Uncharacterized protein n=1 Tax=Phlebia brevispora TaxID=194682 RepID=A0ACC1RLD0_9APHY|nr:hypothetical protein NM688_g8992 [Phlebia brevispora]
MEMAMRVADTLKSFRETRLSALRPLNEFFDIHRLSRPADMNQATSRITYNARYFSGNYGVIVASLAVYALLTNPILLIAMGFLVGASQQSTNSGPTRCRSASMSSHKSPCTPSSSSSASPYSGLSSPLTTIFWVVGASGLLIVGHASLMEPGIESEYAQVQDSV